MDLAYIAAVLEQKHEILVIDVPNEGWELLEEIDGGKYRQGLPNSEIAATNQDGLSLNLWLWRFHIRVGLARLLLLPETVKGVDRNIKIALTGLASFFAS